MSAVLVVAAVGLMFVPGGQILGSTVLYGVVTGAVMGAAAAAVITDVRDAINGTETSAKD